MKDKLYTEKNISLDLNSLEIIYFFIPEYHVFKEQGFSLYPKYEINFIKYNPNIKDTYLEISVEEKKDFIDLFEQEQVNVKIICGKNGVGKSTLIDLLKSVKNPGGSVSYTKNIESITIRNISCIVIYKDKNNNFASTAKTNIYFNNKDISLDSENEYDEGNVACVKYENNSFEKNILNNYVEHKELYYDIFPNNEGLFNGFRYRIWNLKEYVNAFKTGHRRELFEDIDDWNLETALKNNHILYYLFVILRDDIYNVVVDNILQKLAESNKKQDVVSFFEDFWEKGVYKSEYQNTKKITDDFFKNEYSLEEKSSVYKKLLDSQNMVYNLIDKTLDYFGRGLYKQIKEKTPFVSVVYPEGFFKRRDEKRFINDLSSGERKSCEYRYELFNLLSQSNNCLITKDEPENYLHPEWCRKFMNLYMDSYVKTKNYLRTLSKFDDQVFNYQKRFSFIITTHSPFLLSDLTNDYIIYLDKDSKGFSYEKQIPKETFAGNIGEMYCSNMFMENTIGEFARQKLMKIVEDLDNNKKIDVSKLDSYKKLVNKVGDALLRKLLEDKVRMYENNKYIR